MNRKNPLLAPGEREDYGVIITVEMDGAVRVFQETGGVYDALTQLLEHLDGMGQPYRVVTISTPKTIYSDLSGRPNMTVSTKGRRQEVGDERRDIGRAKHPERDMLARIGRLDVAPVALSTTALKKEASKSGEQNVCAAPRCLELAPAGWEHCREHTRKIQRAAMKQAQRDRP